MEQRCSWCAYACAVFRGYTSVPLLTRSVPSCMHTTALSSASLESAHAGRNAH